MSGRSSRSSGTRSKMIISNDPTTMTFTSSTNQNEITSVRGYQTELMEQAKHENLIICLPTGSGKTYIAVMLIKEMSSAIRGSLKKGGKRTVFLVKTVQLVEQQSTYIHTHTDLIVGKYYGELGVDLWHKDKWDVEFENHQVLVFTAQVFLNLIDHDFFSLKYVNLIIFDECHHASGDNQYAALMNKHYDQCLDPPRVLGLTASLTNRKIKPKDLFDNVKELEKTYRAQIASRDESFQYGTSARVETIPCPSYHNEILAYNDSLTIPFDYLRLMVNKIESHLSKKKDQYNKIETVLSHTILTSDYLGDNVTTYHQQSSDYTSFTQSQSVTIIKLKRYFENLIEIGHELGLLGLFIAAKELRKKLKQNQSLVLIAEQDTKEIFDDIFQRFQCLIDDILKNLYRLNLNDSDVLFSPKVLKLIHRIIQQQNIKKTSGRCIVFVERVYTATILSEVLSSLISSLQSPWNNQLKVKHVTGIKTILSDKAMTAKYQSETIKEFRSGDVNILIATAVVEEGLDIPECDLVVRFNKPHNFSSYMQSKGRARAKQNASYVLFTDTSNAETSQRDQAEYDNYEEAEKQIQRGFSRDEYDDDLRDDLSQIPPYRPSEGVVIDATRAAQLIMQYCLLLGNGQVFPPRFLFHGAAGSYTCILSMPANCPVRDDIKCHSHKKKLAKYECCLEMVKKLHEQGEFDEHCLPNRDRTLLKIPIPIENRIFKLVDGLFERKSDSSFEIFSKQIATFPLKSKQSSTQWYLYRIYNDLAFVIPCELIKIPKFHLYGHNDIITVNVIYLKAIHFEQHRNKLEQFCQYLFEYAFDDMNIDFLLKFHLDKSTFKSLPCLLTRSGDIDWNRMEIICNRKEKCVQNYSELTDQELYCPSHLSDRQYYVHLSDHALLKRASDLLDKKKELKSVETYADYFERKVPNIHIRRDSFLATMEGIRKPRINYFKDALIDSKDELHESTKYRAYYPIELLRYAPLNRADMELIYKLPSMLVRISQLYRIERLRKLFADGIQGYSLMNVDQMPPVTFQDYLKINKNTSLLPLVPLTYDNLSLNHSQLQPSTDILFQAVTRRSTDDQMNMENLEILGDCFLKLTVSMSLYHRYPLAGAGALTVEKAKQISNGNLYRIAVQKKLRPYLNVMKINFRGEDANWIPPGYFVGNTQQTQTDDELGVKRYTNQLVKRKAFADMMEAFMGAYLIATDSDTTMQFMKWLGLDIIPLDENKHIKTTPSILCSGIPAEESSRIVQKFYEEQNFNFVENAIRYKFKNKAYLIAAFTHPSSFANRLTNCYERLEFLGDAVLDFLVTRHIFVTKKDITPGRVTDIRQDLSNNGRLAYIFVAYQLQSKILHNSPDLFGKITSYAGDEESFPKNTKPGLILNKDIAQWANTTAPKALADVFEALVGGIFLDSNNCLQTVWEVIEPLLRPYFEHSVTTHNLNPVRWFFENGGKVVSEFVLTDSKTNITTSVCYVEATNGYQFIGRGENKKAAKNDACRKASEFKPVNSAMRAWL